MHDPEVPPRPPGKRGRPKKNWRPDDPERPVILRIRMKNKHLRRIKAIAEHEAEVFAERGWTMSDTCREQLFDWIVRREAEIRLASQARFSGAAPMEEERPEMQDEARLVAKN